MKKFITMAMAVLLIAGLVATFALLTGCEFNAHPSGSDVDSNGNVMTEPAEDITEPTVDITEPTSSELPQGESLPQVDVKILTQIDLENEDRDYNIEYLLLSGLEHDINLQTALNDEIQTFCTWAAFNRDNDDKNINATVEYTILGNKFLSIRMTDSVYSDGADGAAHPENNYRATIFDLETGEHAGSLIAFSDAGDELRAKITDGTFKQVFPEEAIDGALEILAAEFDLHNFYLTNDSLGLFITERPYATGSYWIFEAKYDDIPTLVGSSYFMDFVN